MAGALWTAWPGDFFGSQPLFEVNYHRFTTERGPKAFRYELYVPRALDAKKRYPLVVWLNADPRSVPPPRWENQHQLDNLRFNAPVLTVFSDFAHPEKDNFFILYVANPPRNWMPGVGDAEFATTVTTQTLEILQETMRDHPIDQDRVYLTGFSNGDARCWDLVQRNPDLFAAVAPMGSVGGDVSQAAKLTKVPIWVFHGLDDTTVSPKGDERMAATVRSAGGNIHLSLVPLPRHWIVSHLCWRPALNEYHLVAWMLAQRRGTRCWTPPGCGLWKWWHILTVPCVFLVLVRLGWYFEQRRRSRNSSGEKDRASPP